MGRRPAQAANDQAARAYRAAYLLYAARRLNGSPKPIHQAVRDEARYFRQHVAAQRRRDSVAQFGDTLGTPGPVARRHRRPHLRGVSPRQRQDRPRPSGCPPWTGLKRCTRTADASPNL